MTNQLFGDKTVTYIDTLEEYEEVCANHAWYAERLEKTSNQLAECNEKRKTASNKVEIARLEAQRDVILTNTPFPIWASELRAMLVAQTQEALDEIENEFNEMMAKVILGSFGYEMSCRFGKLVKLEESAVLITTCQQHFQGLSVKKWQEALDYVVEKTEAQVFRYATRSSLSTSAASNLVEDYKLEFVAKFVESGKRWGYWSSYYMSFCKMIWLYSNIVIYLDDEVDGQVIIADKEGGE